MDRLMFIFVLLVLQFYNIQGEIYSLTRSAPWVNKGDDYRFACQIPGGNIPGLIHFKKDNTEACTVFLSICQSLSTDTRYTCGCIDGKNRQIYLDITNVQSTDDGSWTCGNTRLVGATISPPVTLRVYYGPENIRFTPTSSSITVIENDSRSVTCSADCNPPCNINWYKDSAIISSTGLLRLNNIQRQQAGNYTCQVTNTQVSDPLQSKQLMVRVRYDTTDDVKKRWLLEDIERIRLERQKLTLQISCLENNPTNRTCGCN